MLVLTLTAEAAPPPLALAVAASVKGGKSRPARAWPNARVASRSQRIPAARAAECVSPPLSYKAIDSSISARAASGSAALPAISPARRSKAVSALASAFATEIDPLVATVMAESIHRLGGDLGQLALAPVARANPELADRIAGYAVAH